MSGWVIKGLRFFGVMLGIIVLTSFSIDATSTFQGSQSALSIFADKLTTGECPAGMLLVNTGDRDFCIDKFEVSAGEKCPVSNPSSIADTAKNSNDASCIPVAESDKKPWTYVAQAQASQLCAREGKRLPSAEEWYLAALGTPDSISSCNSQGKLSETGEWEKCTSGVGAHDMIGNVWELIDGEVVDGKISGRSIPNDGYVEKVDNDGIATETTDSPNVIYNNDYFWMKPDGRYVIMRGGFYGSRSDGGIYATHSQIDHNFASGAIGFRCVKFLE